LYVRFEAFTAIECSGIFSGDQPCENGVVIKSFGERLCLTLILMLVAQTVSETLDYNATLTQLIAQEDFTAP
jgi:hypothetical protein